MRSGLKWCGLLAAAALSSAVYGQGHEHWRATSNYLEREALQQSLDQIEASRAGIEAIASTASGDWVVVSNGVVRTSSGSASEPANAARRLIADGQTIHAIAVNAVGGWFVVGDSDHETGGQVPAAATRKLNEYQDLGRVVRDLDITASDFVLLADGGRAVWSRSIATSFPGLDRVLRDRHASRRLVQQVALGANGAWAAISGQNVTTSGLPRLRTSLDTMANNRWWVAAMDIGQGDNYVLYSTGRVNTSANSTTDQIEYGLGPAGDTSIFQRMTTLGIPGMSLALVQDGQVTVARGYGVHRQGQDRPVLADSRFDYASLSKYVGALAILALVDDPDVELNLDASVSATYIEPNPRRPLAEWIEEAERRRDRYGIPEDVELEQDFTVRHLLTHTARFRRTGSARVPHELWFEHPVRDMDQLLLGYHCLDRGRPCGFDRGRQTWTDATLASPPGTAYRYSSPGYLVAQAVAEQVARKPAHRIIADKLIVPLGLKEISAFPRLPDEFLADTAWPHGPTGPRDFRMAYPWTFAGGVFGSARDYAELLILGLNQGVSSGGVRILRPERVAEMMSPTPTGLSRGLGVNFDGLGTASDDFFHGGEHGNRARSYMCGNRDSGDGIVILFNVDNGNTFRLRNEILNAFTRVRGWGLTETCLPTNPGGA